MYSVPALTAAGRAGSRGWGWGGGGGGWAGGRLLGEMSIHCSMGRICALQPCHSLQQTGEAAGPRHCQTWAPWGREEAGD